MNALALRLLAPVLVLLALWWGVHAVKARIAHAEQRASTAEQALTDANVEIGLLRSDVASARGDVQIVTRFVDRIRIVREAAAVITREVPVYVTPHADAACIVPRGFVQLHDAAAAAEPPQPAARAGDPDAPAEGLALSAVAATVFDNYAICHETAAQLIALQDKLRAMGAMVDE